MLLTALMVVAGIFWLRWGQSREAKAQGNTDTRAGTGKVDQRARRTGEEERARKIAEFSRSWEEHREALERLLHKEYPKAMARWRLGAPEAKAVEEYGKNYETAFAQRNQAAIAAFQMRNPDGAAKLRYGDCGRLCLCQIFIREWEDGTSILPGRTFGQTYRDLLAEPLASGEVRDIVAAVERTTFRDEASAKLVEAMPSGEAVLDYLRGARTRYDAAAQSALAEAGFDAASRELLPGMMDAEAVRGATAAYRSKSERELNHVRGQMDEALQRMDAGVLAESSQDDPESRRLLTEWKDLQVLRQKMGTESH